MRSNLIQKRKNEYNEARNDFTTLIDRRELACSGAGKLSSSANSGQEEEEDEALTTCQSGPGKRYRGSHGILS